MRPAPFAPILGLLLLSAAAKAGPEDLNRLFENGNTPLHDALRSAYVKDDAECEEIRFPFEARYALPQCFEGDTKTVRALLKKGADPNLQNKFGQTSLHVAVGSGVVANVEALVRTRRVDFSLRDDNGHTALWIAAAHGAKELVRVMLRHGADPNVTNAGGETPLHAAGNVEIARLLVKKGAKLNAKNELGETPLIDAAGESDSTCEPGSAVATWLVRAGASAKARDSRGSTALHQAAWTGNAQLVKLLLAKGVKANDRDEDGLTPLHWFALGAHSCLPVREDYGRTVKTLLKAGARWDDVDAQGRTPLANAVSRNESFVIQLFLELGAPPPEKGPRGASALHLAAYRDSAWSAQRLLKAGSVLDARDVDGRTPLHWAAAHGAAKIASFLVKQGAALDAEDASGRTPLDWAELACEDETRQVLLAAGAKAKQKETPPCPSPPAYEIDPRMERAARAPQADVIANLVRVEIPLEVRDAKGRTPLHVVAGYSFLREELELLLARQPDANARDLDGRTPLHVAAADARMDVASRLVDAGADVNAQDRRGRTPLHLVPYMNDQRRLIAYLIDRGANLTATDRLGRTPLHAAVEKTMWFRPWAEFLVCRGADPEARDLLGWTAVDLAAISGWPFHGPLLCGPGAKAYAPDPP